MYKSGQIIPGASNVANEDGDLDRLEKRYTQIYDHLKQLAERYSQFLSTLVAVKPIAGEPDLPIDADAQSQPATGTVEVFNYVPHFQRFRVNDQVQVVPAATIRRLLDMFGRVLSEEAIPGKVVFYDVDVGDIETQLNASSPKNFADWRTMSDGNSLMRREIR